MSMGYLTPLKQATLPAKPDAAYLFDSGAAVDMLDLSHHTLVLGSTGSGKTLSVALPMLYSLFMRGCGGLIIDLKGNLRAHVRKLAKAAGVEEMLVEYGTGRFATPLNLMENMTFAGYSTFFEGLVKQSFEGKTHNLDFHMRGVSMTVDCAKLLYFLQGKLKKVEVNAATIAEIIVDEQAAQALFSYFKENVFDKKNREHRKLVKSVEASRFHILRKPEEQGDSTRCEQLNYALEGVRVALKRFLATPNVAEKFCAYGTAGLDMNYELVTGRIVLLRFDPDTGSIGEDLARQFISEYYQAVYKHGLQLPKHSFILLDEYQEIADLGPGRFSDRRFVALAREFKACVILLTQSLAALGGTPEAAPNVEALVSNCNTRILFYSDDTATQAMAARYGEVDLTMLKPQEAFVIRYDAATRRHIHNLETVNDAYALGQKMLALGEGEEPPEPGKMPQRIALEEIVEDIEKKQSKLEQKKRKEKQEAAKMTALLGMLEQSCEREAEEPEEAVNTPQNAGYVKMAADGETERKEEIMNNEMAQRFPQFFDAKPCPMPLPAGWKKQVTAAFSLLAASGLALKISNISLSRGSLEVRCAEPESQLLGAMLLNSLLSDLGKTCAVCGEEISRADRASRHSWLGVCSSCREKAGLAPARQEKRDEDIDMHPSWRDV